ncbi:MAG: hypothetical protein ACXWCX_11510, partial [Burkholderiales bacterium]
TVAVPHGPFPAPPHRTVRAVLAHGSPTFFTVGVRLLLLGLARADVRLFEDITWGTDRVVGLTRARLRVLGWRWLELETLWDVDRIADWHRLGRSDLLGSNARTAQVDRCEAADWNPGSVSGSD